MRQMSDIQQFRFQQEHFSDVLIADQFSSLVDLVSHELRTPLTSLIGVLELFDSGHFGPLSEEGQYFLEIAMRSVYRLQRLADTIISEPTTSTAILANNKLTDLQLENEFSSAFDRQEMQLCYQPIVTIATGEITGFEALAQWHHQHKNWVPPHIFIPIAEKTGLIHRLGIWSLKTACCQLQIWQQQFVHHPPLTISVNLSALQFAQANLVEQIRGVLLATNLDPRCVSLNITESNLLPQYESAIAILAQLRTLGTQVYIDNVNVAFSLLGQSQALPIDGLKIDRALIREQNWLMSEVILLIAERLGLEVIAERVETLEELRSLQALGCKQMQGYFFSQPVDSQAASLLLATAAVKSKEWGMPLN